MTLDKQKKKELAAAFAKSFRPMGIFQLRNTGNGKIFVGAAMDLDGMRNRIAFSAGQHEAPFNELKEEWARFGPDSFVYEILDQLKPQTDSPADRAELAQLKAELDALLELWLDKLQPYGDKGYNKKKVIRA